MAFQGKAYPDWDTLEKDVFSLAASVQYGLPLTEFERDFYDTMGCDLIETIHFYGFDRVQEFLDSLSDKVLLMPADLAAEYLGVPWPPRPLQPRDRGRNGSGRAEEADGQRNLDPTEIVIVAKKLSVTQHIQKQVSRQKTSLQTRIGGIAPENGRWKKTAVQQPKKSVEEIVRALKPSEVIVLDEKIGAENVQCRASDQQQEVVMDRDENWDIEVQRRPALSKRPSAPRFQPSEEFKLEIQLVFQTLADQCPSYAVRLTASEVARNYVNIFDQQIKAQDTFGCSLETLLSSMSDILQTERNDGNELLYRLASNGEGGGGAVARSDKRPEKSPSSAYRQLSSVCFQQEGVQEEEEELLLTFEEDRLDLDIAEDSISPEFEEDSVKSSSVGLSLLDTDLADLETVIAAESEKQSTSWLGVKSPEKSPSSSELLLAGSSFSPVGEGMKKAEKLRAKASAATADVAGNWHLRNVTMENSRPEQGIICMLDPPGLTKSKLPNTFFLPDDVWKKTWTVLFWYGNKDREDWLTMPAFNLLYVKLFRGNVLNPKDYGADSKTFFLYLQEWVDTKFNVLGNLMAQLRNVPRPADHCVPTALLSSNCTKDLRRKVKLTFELDGEEADEELETMDEFLDAFPLAHESLVPAECTNESLFNVYRSKIYYLVFRHFPQGICMDNTQLHQAMLKKYGHGMALRDEQFGVPVDKLLCVHMRDILYYEKKSPYHGWLHLRLDIPLKVKKSLLIKVGLLAEYDRQQKELTRRGAWLPAAGPPNGDAPCSSVSADSSCNSGPLAVCRKVPEIRRPVAEGGGKVGSKVQSAFPVDANAQFFKPIDTGTCTSRNHEEEFENLPQPSRFLGVARGRGRPVEFSEELPRVDDRGCGRERNFVLGNTRSGGGSGENADRMDLKQYQSGIGIWKAAGTAGLKNSGGEHSKKKVLRNNDGDGASFETPTSSESAAAATGSSSISKRLGEVCVNVDNHASGGISVALADFSRQILKRYPNGLNESEFMRELKKKFGEESHDLRECPTDVKFLKTSGLAELFFRHDTDEVWICSKDDSPEPACDDDVPCVNREYRGKSSIQRTDDSETGARQTMGCNRKMEQSWDWT